MTNVLPQQFKIFNDELIKLRYSVSLSFTYTEKN